MAADIRVFRRIRKLYTLEPAAQKNGRRVQSTDLGLIENAAIIARDGRIEWVGREAELPKLPAEARETDLSGSVIVPAFVECHTHLIYGGERASEFERRQSGESYQSIARSGGGILSTVSKTRAAGEDELTRIAQTRVDRFLRQGVTTIEIKSGYGLDVESELSMLRAAGRVKGARIVRTFLGAHAIPKDSTAEAYADMLIRDAFPRLEREGLACRIDIFVEDGYFPETLARRYLLAARERGFDLVVHADQLTHSGGARLAVELGARSAEHLIRIDDEDIRKLAASDVTCVLLPMADLYMRCPYPPARALIDQGARVAIATDFNPGTSPSQDIALTGLLARLEMKMSLPEVLAAYTVGAAHALGLEREIGSLSAGKVCDFCILDEDLEGLFYEAGRQPVRQVYRSAEALVLQ